MMPLKTPVCCLLLGQVSVFDDSIEQLTASAELKHQVNVASSTSDTMNLLALLDGSGGTTCVSAQR